MPFLLVLLVAVASLGLGGYSAWATLTLEIGAALLLVTVLNRRPREPGASRSRTEPHPASGLRVPLALLTLWIGLSLVPIPRSMLRVLTPRAFSLRAEVETLEEGTGFGEWGAPLSLSPYLTAESAWLWLAVLALFVVSLRIAAHPKEVRRLSVLLLVLGAGFGAFGLGQWLALVAQAPPRAPNALRLGAFAAFGNRNHYAAFLEMLFLPSLGWLGYEWLRWKPGHRGLLRKSSTPSQEAGARLVLAGAATTLTGLAILFSLSRSAVAFTLAGSAFWAWTTRSLSHQHNDGFVDVGTTRKRRSYAPALVLALIVLGSAVFLGLEPVMERYQLVTEELRAERGRWQVWKDSMGAVRDFWATGSGLATFSKVFPIHRTFGGTTLYSWAHNDYLQLLIELGLPGALLLVWVALGAVRAAKRVHQDALANPPIAALHAGYGAGLLAIALHSATDFGLHLPANAALASILLGVTLGMKPHPLSSA